MNVAFPTAATALVTYVDGGNGEFLVEGHCCCLSQF
jgi:hypothetical protein